MGDHGRDRNGQDPVPGVVEVNGAAHDRRIDDAEAAAQRLLPDQAPGRPMYRPQAVEVSP